MDAALIKIVLGFVKFFFKFIMLVNTSFAATSNVMADVGVLPGVPGTGHFVDGELHVAHNDDLSAVRQGISICPQPF